MSPQKSREGQEQGWREQSRLSGAQGGAEASLPWGKRASCPDGGFSPAGPSRGSWSAPHPRGPRRSPAHPAGTGGTSRSSSLAPGLCPRSEPRVGPGVLVRPPHPTHHSGATESTLAGLPREEELSQDIRGSENLLESCGVARCHTPHSNPPPNGPHVRQHGCPQGHFGEVMGALASCRSLLHLSARVRDPGHLPALQLPRKSGSTGAGFCLRTWDRVRQRSPARRRPPHDPKLPSGC